MQPIWTDDAWSIWAIKAVSIVELGGLDPAFLGSASLVSADYPLVVPVLELVAYRFCGLPNELVPLQLGLVFLAFPWALAALLRDRARPLLLWVVVLAIALAPSLQIQTASAVADITLAVFFALAGVAAWRWVEDGEREQLWLAGLFCAVAVGTKVEGAVFVLLLLGAVAVGARRHGRPLRPLAAVAAAILAAALPWELWSRANGLGNAFSESGGVGSVDLLAVADRIPRAAASIIRELAYPSAWLALVALAAAAIALALWRPAGRELAAFTLFVTLSSLAALIAIYWTTPLDFDYHVATSVRRVVTAPVLFAAAMTPLLLTRRLSSRGRRRACPRPSARPRTRPAPEPGRAAPEPARELGVAEQLVELRGEAGGVARLDELAGLAVGTTISGTALTRVATIGSEASIASSRTIPKPSQRDEWTKTSARSSQSRISRRPGSRTAPSRPSSRTRARVSASSGPLPRIASRASGCARGRV